ncbi:MAG: sigma-70 family RNA polymerase sigma factor [Planctomycetaceae bacterium]|nr:sigma-70 family RNA polymerase sigma factor [Planctomycetaceae bacterium]
MNQDTIQRLQEARQGDSASLGILLARHRSFLRTLAQIEIGRRLQGKVDASDVVQEVFLQAHRGITGFQGESDGQLVRWLQTILAGTLANTLRRYLGTQCRDIRLEQQVSEDLDRSALSLNGLLVDPHSSPSRQVARGEQAHLAIEALSRLPDDYQQVLILRHVEGLTFPEIASRMERSVDSVEKLWLRGLTRLKREFTGSADVSMG